MIIIIIGEGKEKVKLIFKPAPGAEKVVSKGKDYLEVTIKGDKSFAEILTNLQKKLPYFKDKYFLFYVSNQFAVYPNAILRDIYNNFGSGGYLTVNYALNEAWG